MYIPIYKQDAHTRALVTETTLTEHKPAAIIKYNGYYEEGADYKTFPFKEVFYNAPLRRKRGKNKDKIYYYDLVATFDIETSTLPTDPPESFMYHWQFCIESVVFFGRTWAEFQELLAILTRKLNLSITEDEDGQSGRALVCYICNLAFEFQFMRYYLPPLVSPLFTDKYKPLYVPTSSGIVFRCAARLFNKTLEKITAGRPHAKLAGDLDYSIIRTPKTRLTPQEQAYCYNDVRGLAEAIRERLDRDAQYNIANIPLTSTGYVRKDCQRAMSKNPENRKIFLNTKLTPRLYGLCRDAFRGGNTHANAAYTGLHLHHVASNDISSSYPFQILVRGFPHGKWYPADTRGLLDHFTEIIKTHCLLMRVVFFDIEYNAPDNIAPLSASKCIIDGYNPNRKHQTDDLKIDNGRVFKAAKLETCLTEIDLLIILTHYKIKGGVKIIEAYHSTRQKLPEELRNVTLEYYKAKTLLKHSTDPDDIYNYNRAKELLNSTYGMMVQRLDRTDFELINNIYVPNYKPLKDQIDAFYNKRSSFLRYDHGLYITSWARYQLQQAIDIVGADFVYCDTDSVKYLNPENHAAQFDKLNEKLKAMAEKAGAVAYTAAGEPVYCGVFDFEGVYTDFCTLGAKKYLYSYDGQTIHATIAGVNKKVGRDFFTSHGFEYFKDGQILAESGKLTAYYLDTPPHDITVQGETINTAASVSLIDAPYTINVKGEYQEFIDYLRHSIEQYYP